MRKYLKRVVRYTWMPLKIAVLGKSLPIKKKIYLMISIKKKKKKYDNKNRKRKIICFFCRRASTKVDKYFLKLIDKHFKHDSILHKIFNRKTLKISYSCTKNIFEIINNHNKEIIKEFQDRTNNNNNNQQQKENLQNSRLCYPGRPQDKTERMWKEG